MNWNYRLLATRHTIDEGTTVEWYSIYRVYYDNDGAISSVTTTPIAPGGSTVEEIRKEVHLMLQAFERPVLSFEHFPEVDVPANEGDVPPDYVNQ